ncbi:uncharacterized protein LOC142358396 [Convolutriloba macropyga]|uniref:uncharacterized protein LOC142358396 n=1 Tax=Convolutriloba macropyga TaxID=536237 RepID=UPI003F51BCDB
MSSMKKFIVKKKSVEKTETTQSASTTESSERTSVKRQVSGTSGTVVTSQISSGGEISTETRSVDPEVLAWAKDKNCIESVGQKVALFLNKYHLRELKEWMKSDLKTYLDFCSKDMDLHGIELLDFSAALRDTDWK